MSAAAVVTGAGSGIGRALAQALDLAGTRLALADIDGDRLRETAAGLAGEPLLGEFDVADRGAFEDFAASAQNALGPIDTVFNNAGVALLQPVQQMRYEDLQWLLGINFWGVIHGVHAFLPAMLERRQGTIVNISSLYGLIGWGANSAYCAAKFGVRGYTEAMRWDLRGSGVRAVCVHPGGIRTNVVRNARFSADDRGRTDPRALIEEFDRLAARTSAERAAAVILDGLRRGRQRIVIGADARLVDQLQRWLPSRYIGVIGALERRLRR